MFDRTPGCAVRAPRLRLLSVATLVALPLHALPAQDAPPLPLQSLAQIWDTAAVRRVIAGFRGAPKTPQIVAIGYAHDGVVTRLATTDSVLPELRQALRDSLPRLLRVARDLAGLELRFFLVEGKPARLLPSCDLLAARIRPTNEEEVDDVIHTSLGGIPSPVGATVIRTGQRPRGPSEVKRAGVDALLIAEPNGRITTVQVSPPTTSRRVAEAVARGAQRYTFAPVEGAVWSDACLLWVSLSALWSEMPTAFARPGSRPGMALVQP